MKTIEQTTKELKTYSGTTELIGVLIEYTFEFFTQNFVKEGKIYLPTLLNPFFIYKAAKFVIILVEIVKLYKEDYELWKIKYWNKTIDIHKIYNILNK